MKLFLLSLLATPAYAGDCENYCVGVRGNGELEPAHPAALARMTEDYGLPKTLAGGSSATVSMFFLEQVRANAKVAGEPSEERRRKLQALMLKTMPEFEAAMTKDAKVVDGYGMMKAFGGGDPKQIKEAIAAFKNAGGMSPEELKATLGKYGPLLNPELLRLVMSNPVKFGPEAVKSITNLGAFNAVTDDTIFFRPGLIDFKGVAVVLGYMGDFYAGNTDPETKEKLDKFLDDCADSTYHKEWGDAPKSCREGFAKIAAEYLRNGKFQNKALFEKVKTSLPTTAVLKGDGMSRYLQTKRAYEQGKVKNIADFAVDFKKDMAFGYWGDPSQLSAVGKGLEKYREMGDAKATHFQSLGSANWFEVLATSPAEPGIANAQPIPMDTTREQVLAELAKPSSKRWQGLHYRKDVLSVGGWSDLHPTAVLKATPGCDRVIYLTRHANYGDSKFGQQIFIRLTGSKKDIPFWDKIGDGGAGGWCDDKILAAGGDPAAVRGTPWNQISNLCNPESSFRRALDVSDAAYCTDWDNGQYDVFQEKMRDLIKHVYEAPLIPTTGAGAECRLNDPPGHADPRALPGCLPYPKRAPGGRPTPEDDRNSRSAE